jgi:multisubunit Na+/H+ antiporter MnhF subunit
VNHWLVAALVLMVLGLGPCLVAGARGPALHRLVALDVASGLTVATLLLLAQGFGRSSYVDVALVLAVLSTTGVLVFTRFLGKTL